MATKSVSKIVFGDFQTPQSLADSVCELLRQQEHCPRSVLEPTCGVGTFLSSAAQYFPLTERLVGREINDEYLQECRRALANRSIPNDLKKADFFETNWNTLLARLPQPILILGNPPWVTNSQLGAIGSVNLPQKGNLDGQRGIDAITGKSNFDISQWMIETLIDAVHGKRATLAFLCKSMVARRVIQNTWKKYGPTFRPSLFRIDAKLHFQASVDACLLCGTFDDTSKSYAAPLFESLDRNRPLQTFGWHDQRLVANQHALDRHKQLCADTKTRNWRSGLKHDCQSVFVLHQANTGYTTLGGEQLDLEPEAIFPYWTATDLFHNRATYKSKRLIVTQRSPSEDTRVIQRRNPKLWAYLSRNTERLSARKSSIYRNQPQFSIFGVGPYSFALWKVAISALRKKLRFRVVPPFENRPVMLDDTTYFLPFESESEAVATAEALNHKDVEAFFSAWIFWDAKRPITAEILHKLDLQVALRERNDRVNGKAEDRNNQR